MPEPSFDLAKAHRWFAIECNNEAWDLLEKPDRTAEQSARLIHIAHAAWLHWKAVGGPINELRAECLLANVYNAMEQSDHALRHAERCVSLSNAAPADQTPFDIATALGCLAQAHAGAGHIDKAKELKQQALAAADTIEAAEDRAVFDQILAAGKWHGVDSLRS